MAALGEPGDDVAVAAEVAAVFGLRAGHVSAPLGLGSHGVDSLGLLRAGRVALEAAVVGAAELGPADDVSVVFAGDYEVCASAFDFCVDEFVGLAVRFVLREAREPAGAEWAGVFGWVSGVYRRLGGRSARRLPRSCAWARR